jgi:hypothetical protein
MFGVVFLFLFISTSLFAIIQDRVAKGLTVDPAGEKVFVDC